MISVIDYLLIDNLIDIRKPGTPSGKVCWLKIERYYLVSLIYSWANACSWYVGRKSRHIIYFSLFYSCAKGCKMRELKVLFYASNPKKLHGENNNYTFCGTMAVLNDIWAVYSSRCLEFLLGISCIFFPITNTHGKTHTRPRVAGSSAGEKCKYFFYTNLAPRVWLLCARDSSGSSVEK